MAYTLQAIIAKSGSFPTLPAQLRITALAPRLEMLALGTKALSHYRIPFCPLTDEGEHALPERLVDLCKTLSRGCTLAYVEAEHFGGVGSEGYALFSGGVQLGKPVVTGGALNEALRCLGFEKGSALDEFAAAGLGRHRSTDEWLA